MQTVKPILSRVPGATALDRPASRTLACQADLGHRQMQPIRFTRHAAPRISHAPHVVSGLANNALWHPECAVAWFTQAGRIGNPPTSNGVPVPAVALHSRSHDDQYCDGTAGSSCWVRYHTQ